MVGHVTKICAPLPMAGACFSFGGPKWTELQRDRKQRSHIFYGERKNLIVQSVSSNSTVVGA